MPMKMSKTTLMINRTLTLVYAFAFALQIPVSGMIGLQFVKELETQRHILANGSNAVVEE